MYGWLIAEDRPQDPLYKPDLAGEHLLVLGGWWHRPFQEIVTELMQPGRGWPGDAADSLLFNGKGLFRECDPSVVDQVSTVCNEQCAERETLQVTSGGQYRIRIGSQASQSAFNLAIENHTMTVIEVDGHPITPISVTSLDLSAGQRYSVLVNADQPPGAYHISVWAQIDGNRGGLQLGSAVLKYDSAPTSQLRALNEEVITLIHNGHQDDKDFAFDQQGSYKALPGITPVAPSAKEVTKRWVFRQTREYYETGVQENDETPLDHCNATEQGWKWSTNRAYYESQLNTPVSLSVYDGDTATFTPERGYYGVERGDVVEVVLQNYRACGGICYTHPWHLHGHHFWVVGQGHGEWTGSERQLESLERGDGILRDTVSVPSENKSLPVTPCGWVAIRFVADNPGAWNFHCHLEWHTIMGMNTVIWYTDGSLPKPPPNMPCRLEAVDDAAVDGTPPVDKTPSAGGEDQTPVEPRPQPPHTDGAPTSIAWWLAPLGVAVMYALGGLAALVVVALRGRRQDDMSSMLAAPGGDMSAPAPGEVSNKPGDQV